MAWNIICSSRMMFVGIPWTSSGSAFTAEGPGSIPDKGTNPTGHVVQPKKEKNMVC